MAPTKPSSFTARLSSTAAASGLCSGKMIVELARERDAIGAGKQIRTRAAVGEHLHGDAGLVHRFEPDLADLGQELQRIWRARGEIARPITAAVDDVFRNALTKRGHREVLLKGNGTHRRFPSRLERDPEKRVGFRKRSCLNNELKRNDDST